MSTNQKQDRIYLREDETTLLQSLLQEWHEKPDKNTRDAFVTGTVLPQLQQLNSKEYGPDIISTDKVAKVRWEGRISAVHNWLRNHRPFKERQVFKLERKIPLRRVVGKVKTAAIEAIITDKHPDLHKGDKTYPGVYQQAVTELMSQMSDEETTRMQELLVEWQTDGPPLDLRIKAGKKYGRKAIVNAHQLLDKEMYMSCITLSMAPDPDTGAMGVTCHDYIAELHAAAHGKRFKSFREWAGPKYSTFMEQIIDYANYVRDQRNEEPEQDDAGVAPIVFEAGPGDLPLLPAPVHGVRSAEIAKHARLVIRAYFLRHYKLATGCESARTPWATIGEDPGKFFDMACLPVNFPIKDPSRMGVSVKTLLTHLRQRQEQHGVQAFFFHHILRNNELEPAEYPEGAAAALNSKPVGHVNSTQKKEPEEEVIIPSIKGKGKETNPNPGIGTSDSTAYDPALMAISLPAPPAQQHPFAYHHSAFPGPPHNPASHNSTAPIVPPPLHPPIMPTDPRYAMMFHQYMSQMGMGQQGWGAPAIPPAQQAFHPPEHHYGLQPPGGAMFPSIPLPTPFPPPFPPFDPHPIPAGEPPFSHLFQSLPMDQTSGPVMPMGPPITTPSKKNLTKTPGNTTPSKKNLTKTPGKSPVKTPGKRKRQEVEDSPSKTPTRVSSRQRTQTKPFEIQ